MKKLLFYNTPIYVIVGITSRDDSNVAGFYYAFDEAENAIMSNTNDVWDNLYRYMVIERALPGCFQGAFNEQVQWYTSDLVDESLGYKYDNLLVKKIDRPSKYDNIVGWSMA